MARTARISTLSVSEIASEHRVKQPAMLSVQISRTIANIPIASGEQLAIRLLGNRSTQFLVLIIDSNSDVAPYPSGSTRMGKVYDITRSKRMIDASHRLTYGNDKIAECRAR